MRGCLRRDANEGDADEGGRQATAKRAMMAAMAPAMTWVMVRLMRLAGDKEGKDESCNGNGDGDMGGGQQRGQGPQRDGDGNKDGG